MSLARRLSLKNLKAIEIVSSSKNYASYKNGYLVCHITQDSFRTVVLPLWRQMMDIVVMTGMCNTLNAAICQLKGKKR